MISTVRKTLTESQNPGKKTPQNDTKCGKCIISQPESSAEKLTKFQLCYQQQKEWHSCVYSIRVSLFIPCMIPSIYCRFLL